MRRIFLFILLVIALNVQGGEPRRVLLIHSFGQEFEPFTTFSGDFRSELARRSPEPLDFFDVALASARFEETNESPMVDYLLALFRGHHVDLVVTLGAPAAHFAQEHRGRLFPETPMLLTCVAQRMLQSSTLTDKDAAIGVRHDPRMLVEAILRLMPDTTNVVFVFGGSPLERFWVNEFIRESQLPTNHVGCESFSQLSFEQMKQRAAALPPGSVILFGDLLVDADGIPTTGDEALAKLHAVANAPIFGIHDMQLGHGIVGGPLVPVRELAHQAASAAARILAGEPPAGFRPPPIGASVPTYDWRELRRWNIGQERLPAGSVIMYRTPATWERHRIVILTGSSLLVLQAVLITGLVLSLRRRRKAEHSLRESEERMKLAAGAAELVMWDWDLASDKDRSQGNGSDRSNGEDHSDYGRFLQTVCLQDREGVVQAMAKAINEDGSYEHIHRAASNGVRWIAGRGRVEFDAKHKPIRMRGVGMDITARKAAEERANEAAVESQRAQRELAHVSRVSMLIELAGSLAHELNQPLAAVVHNAEATQRFMEDIPSNEEEMREALQDIRDAGLRAGEIIARMRAMLTKDLGPMAQQDLNLAVKEVFQMLPSELVSRRVMTTLQLDPHLPMVNGHGVQLRQVLLNLIMNACDAMSVVATSKRQLTVESKRVDVDKVEISIADTGPGFPEEALRHVFEPFRTTKANGLGLGLAICRSIIRTHGGRLTAANRQDGGAMLRFTLPIQNQRET